MDICPFWTPKNNWHLQKWAAAFRYVHAPINEAIGLGGPGRGGKGLLCLYSKWKPLPSPFPYPSKYRKTHTYIYIQNTQQQLRVNDHLYNTPTNTRNKNALSVYTNETNEKQYFIRWWWLFGGAAFNSKKKSIHYPVTGKKKRQEEWIMESVSYHISICDVFTGLLVSGMKYDNLRILLNYYFSLLISNNPDLPLLHTATHLFLSFCPKFSCINYLIFNTHNVDWVCDMKGKKMNNTYTKVIRGNFGKTGRCRFYCL